MPLSWNEIRARAHTFVDEWTRHPLPKQGAEKAEAQTFWNEFFRIFGKERRHVAAFEAPVKNIGGHFDRIDLLWSGTLIAEHKSPGGDLGKAHAQALGYVTNLVNEGREKECPRWVVVSNFTHIALHDLQPEQNPDLPLFKRIPPTIVFPLAELPQRIHAFGFMAGYRTWRLKEEDPANIEAAELLAQLHDVLQGDGYPKEHLDRFLVRILFCLFAEDTGIFDPDTFRDFLVNRTKEDGSDLGLQLEQFFRVLDQEETKRQKNLGDELAELPYVNGKLFADRLEFASFNKPTRDQLLACTTFKWSQISPAVFGSLFQTVMQPAARRQIGAHYTTERDILKLLRSLFLDDLHAEFKQISADRSNRRESRLRDFQTKLASINLLDPACGCGNFLVIAYRELRDLEIAVLAELKTDDQRELTADEFNKLSMVDVDQIYGIEIADWPAKIAEAAVWLMDHLENQKLSTALGLAYRRLPLRKSAKILCANALRTDWNTVLPAAHCTYVLGNPPFVGAKYQSPEQRADMEYVVGNVDNGGLLDFVTAWYFKAGEYISSFVVRPSGGSMVREMTPQPFGLKQIFPEMRSPRCAFVSTNSISQGEQVGILWNGLRKRWPIQLHFAHRTFAWTSEAQGMAHVHVVIIGFGLDDIPVKKIYDYDADPDHPSVTIAQNISPYLVEGPNLAITNRTNPLCDAPEIGIGNKPIDGGNYLFTPEEKSFFTRLEPASAKFFKRWKGSEEFINDIERWCLWLGECSPAQLHAMPEALTRVENVRKLRLDSKSAPTRKLADKPARFHVENMPKGNFLVVPKVSSERRKFIPMAFETPATLISDLCFLIPGATKFHFGVLSSTMHMAWTRQVCGRLKSDYRYSAGLVYNNFPWPNPTPAQKTKVEEKAKAVLDVRARHLPPRGMATLALLYDPRTTPAELVDAHAELDRAVERCYRAEKFHSDRERVEHLFALYEKLTAPLLPATPTFRAKRQTAVKPAAPKSKPRTPALPEAPPAP